LSDVGVPCGLASGLALPGVASPAPGTARAKSQRFAKKASRGPSRPSVPQAWVKVW
jgi:hypothetical protein